jgi:2-oxoisovalerate dehydrogenase E1 component alpha subunit
MLDPSNPIPESFVLFVVSSVLKMKRIRLSRPHPALLRRGGPQKPALLLSTPLTSRSSPSPSQQQPRRHAGSISQRPDSKHVMFPGAVKSAFTNTMAFEQPSTYPALPTYRAVDQNGVAVDPSFVPDLSDEEVVKLYRDMLTVSIMDVIMFDAQRQGRLSFYMVSAGEEAVSVGTASALAKEDVVFCQYREQGVFKQRGFTLADFMNQLFANQKDPGKGRNMPVHYGSRELNIVGFSLDYAFSGYWGC